MSRLPYAAKTLIEQVTEAKSQTKVELHGEPDGLGVFRTIKFNKATSKWLAPLIEEMNDARIESSELTDAGYLHVTFVPTPAADTRSLFPLEAAAEVSRNSTPSEE